MHVWLYAVGVLDGYLLLTVTPAKKHAKNVRSYFSGHYQKYGIGIQACCDAHCCFLFVVGIGGPGVTRSDRMAVKDSGLFDLVVQPESSAGLYFLYWRLCIPTKN